MMPSLVGSKRLREDFEDDVAQIRNAVLQALSRHENPEAGLQEVVADFSKNSQDVLSQNPTEVVYYLRVTLQHLITAAHKGQEPLMNYRLSKKGQPAVQTLLKVAAGLSHSGGLSAGEVFSLILDVVETNRAEDVKACLMFMGTLWDSWSTLQANFGVSPKTRLAFQKVYNMFCQRISNNQDAEVLGAVATVVAKLMPFNDPAGLNTPFHCNQHHIPMDESIGASVDGSDPVDLPFYRQLWELQLLFQRPHDQTEPEQWAETVSGIQVVLDMLRDAPIGVASRTTAVPQDGGKSVIVKYLTSSKLTRLQLRDAAFRRTLLLQCLVLLHACAHPIPRKAKPGGGGTKLPVPVLKEKQLAELRSMESQLYDELSKTPKQGGAFADVIKTVLDRETAFLKWKVDGTANFWDKPAAAPAAGPKVSSSLERPLPPVPARRAPEEPSDLTAPDTTLDLSRMWDNSGAEEDLYRRNRDPRMLPSADEHLAQVGKEIAGDVRHIKQYANTKAPGGVDPLYLFRAQRMLQRKDIHVWKAATQIDMAGERLEIAFDTLYPGKVGPSWKRPEVPNDDEAQKGPKRPCVRPAPGRAVSGTIEEELAGVKPSADASMPQAGEDTVQPASEQEAGVPHVAAGDEVGSLAVDIKSTQGGTDMTNPQDAADQGIPEAGDAANGVALSDHQTATPEPASAGADPVSTATAAVEAASELPTQAASNSGAMEQELAVPVVPVEAADGHQSSAGSEAVAVGKGPKAKALLHVDAANKHASLIDVPIQSDVAVPMDEDVT